MKLKNCIGYEYRKMARRKSFWIALFLAPVLLVFLSSGIVFGKIYVEGELAGTHMDEIAIRKETAEGLNGTILTEEFFQEIAEQEYEHPLEGYTASNYLEYEKKNSRKSMIKEVIYSLTNGQEGDSVYTVWRQKQRADWEEKGLSKSEISWMEEQADENEIPWTYAYNEGYEQFANYMTFSMLCMAILLTVCLSPIFADEYSLRMDVLLLTSKNGRMKTAAAKLIAGFSFSAISSGVFYGVFLAGQIWIYGAGDVTAAVQLLPAFSNVPYHLNTAQVSILLITAGILSSMATAAIVMAFSAAAGSSFGPAVIGLILAFVPMITIMGEPQNRVLASLINAIPGVYGTGRSLFSCCLLTIQDLHLPAYQYLPVFYLMAIVLLSVFTGRRYLSRQGA